MRYRKLTYLRLIRSIITGKTYVQYPGQIDIDQSITFTAYCEKLLGVVGVSRTWDTYVTDGAIRLLREFPDGARV